MTAETEAPCSAGDAGVIAGISLDPAEGPLTRDGARVRLRPKTLAVLMALIDRRGAVVRQDELKTLVWGTRFGNEAGPKQCIAELRRLLGDTPSAPRCIETVCRSGYRLLAGSSSSAARAPSRHPSRSALAAPGNSRRARPPSAAARAPSSSSRARPAPERRG